MVAFLFRRRLPPFHRREIDAPPVECLAGEVLYSVCSRSLYQFRSNLLMVEDVMLQIRLLGQFDVRIDGKRILIPSRAGQSLLAYLLLTAGTPHRREKLAGILWPDFADDTARKN